MMLQIGAQAPDFSLREEHGQPVRLSELRGEKNVALVFYPFAFSGICTRELDELRDNLGAFEDRDVQVLAISCDAVHTLRAWTHEQGYPFPLLSDFWPHGEITRRYGVFNEQSGTPLRGTFLVDTAGVLRWSVVKGMGEARSLAGYQEAIAAL